MANQLAPSNGIEICYDTFGDRSDPPLLLVMGFTAQLIAWNDVFCTMLADRGRFVIRFDNRDVGLSTHLDGVPVDLPAVLAASERRGRDAAGALHAVHVLRRRLRPARPPRHRARPHRGRVDGRDDRADHGGGAPAAGAVDDLDHVHHRRSGVLPVGARGDGGADDAAAHGTGRVHQLQRRSGQAVLQPPVLRPDRTASIAARRLRPGVLPGGCHAPAGRRPSSARPGPMRCAPSTCPPW